MKNISPGELDLIFSLRAATSKANSSGESSAKFTEAATIGFFLPWLDKDGIKEVEVCSGWKERDVTSQRIRHCCDSRIFHGVECVWVQSSKSVCSSLSPWQVVVCGGIPQVEILESTGVDQRPKNDGSRHSKDGSDGTVAKRASKGYQKLIVSD
jgi:hypothetical protein